VVIAADPAPDAAAALRAQRPGPDHGNQSSRRRSAFDKVLGLVVWPSAHELADIPAARRVDHRSNRLSRSAWAKQQSREEENHGD